MIRLLFITDYSDSYANRLLKGITDYSKDKGQWSICRMPTYHKQSIGIEGILEIAREWEIDVIIGTFEDGDDIGLLRSNGIIVIAQDFKKRLHGIPNITGNYKGTGKMAAGYFIDRGFRTEGRVLVGRKARRLPQRNQGTWTRGIPAHIQHAGYRPPLVL